MRVAAQAKMGYYPIDDGAAGLIARRLSRSGAAKLHGTKILDPCAGEGRALSILANALGLDLATDAYAIELDGHRADQCRALGIGNVLGAATFFAAKVPHQSFGLVYCNPPYDFEVGGGIREEERFAIESVKRLVPEGILVLVVPIETIRRDDVMTFLDTRCEGLGVWALPEDVRAYREVVYIGKRRKTEWPESKARFDGFLRTSRLWARDYTPNYLDGPMGLLPFEVPPSHGPKVFRKGGYTPEELERIADDSPLLKLFREPVTRPLRRPPLPAFTGHISQMLASGMLDGLLEPPGEAPHVVRGTARKLKAKTEESVNVNEDTGVATEKTVITEFITISVRTVDAEGIIRTLEQKIALAPIEE